MKEKAELYQHLTSTDNPLIVGAKPEDLLVNFEEKKEQEELRKADPKNKFDEFSKYKIKKRKR